jgi:hypothetical protein
MKLYKNRDKIRAKKEGTNGDKEIKLKEKRQ